MKQRNRSPDFKSPLNIRLSGHESYTINDEVLMVSVTTWHNQCKLISLIISLKIVNQFRVIPIIMLDLTSIGIR